MKRFLKVLAWTLAGIVILAALGWMAAAFAFDWWIFSASATVSGHRGWVEFIGRYDAPWRDLQLAGFAGGMILGVSQRFLPFIYGFTLIVWFILCILMYAGYLLKWGYADKYKEKK
jgi:hypothetical protein